MKKSPKIDIKLYGILQEAGMELEKSGKDRFIRALTESQIWVTGIVAQSFLGWTKGQVRNEVELGKKIMRSR